jgi:hypothetical protein
VSKVKSFGRWIDNEVPAVHAVLDPIYRPEEELQMADAFQLKPCSKIVEPVTKKKIQWAKEAELMSEKNGLSLNVLLVSKAGAMFKESTDPNKSDAVFLFWSQSERE